MFRKTCIFRKYKKKSFFFFFFVKKKTIFKTETKINNTKRFQVVWSFWCVGILFFFFILTINLKQLILSSITDTEYPKSLLFEHFSQLLIHAEFTSKWFWLVRPIKVALTVGLEKRNSIICFMCPTQRSILHGSDHLWISRHLLMMQGDINELVVSVHDLWFLLYRKILFYYENMINIWFNHFFLKKWKWKFPKSKFDYCCESGN